MADEQPKVEQTTETQETKEEQTNQEVTKAPETKFTEEDVNNIVKQRLAKERASIYKKLDVEDLDTAVHAVKATKEAEQQKQIQKGEFEKILKEKSEEFGKKLSGLETELRDIKVNKSLLSSASKFVLVVDVLVIPVVGFHCASSEARQNCKLAFPAMFLKVLLGGFGNSELVFE